jgi:hypothetical protein
MQLIVCFLVAIFLARYSDVRIVIYKRDQPEMMGWSHLYFDRYYYQLGLCINDGQLVISLEVKGQ